MIIGIFLLCLLYTRPSNPSNPSPYCQLDNWFFCERNIVGFVQSLNLKNNLKYVGYVQSPNFVSSTIHFNPVQI